MYTSTRVYTSRVMQLIKGDFGRITMVIIVLPKAIISDQVEGLIYSGTKLLNSVAEFSEGQRVNCKFMKCI
jgi:hypothetical protein